MLEELFYSTSIFYKKSLLFYCYDLDLKIIFFKKFFACKPFVLLNAFLNFTVLVASFYKKGKSSYKFIFKKIFLHIYYKQVKLQVGRIKILGTRKQVGRERTGERNEMQKKNEE